MVTLDDIRQLATALPEVEEYVHFGQPSFRVRTKPFAGVEKGGTTAVFSVTLDEAKAAVAEAGAQRSAETAGGSVYEEVWRTAGMTIFIGLRVELSKVTRERVAELVEHAWRAKAPKRLVAAYDAR